VGYPHDNAREPAYALSRGYEQQQRQASGLVNIDRDQRNLAIFGAEPRALRIGAGLSIQTALERQRCPVPMLEAIEEGHQMPPASLVRRARVPILARWHGSQRTSRTWSDLVMAEDLVRLGCPDLDGGGWDCEHPYVTETSYISHMRAELVRHEHKDRGGVARSATCKVFAIPEDLIPPSGMMGNAAYVTAEFGAALTDFVVDRLDLLGQDPRPRNGPRRRVGRDRHPRSLPRPAVGGRRRGRRRPDRAEGAGRARRLGCDGAGVGGPARPPTLGRPCAPGGSPPLPIWPFGAGVDDVARPPGRCPSTAEAVRESGRLTGVTDGRPAAGRRASRPR